MIARFKWAIQRSIEEYQKGGLPQLCRKIANYFNWKFHNNRLYVQLYWILRGNLLLNSSNGYILTHLFSDKSYHFPELKYNHTFTKMYQKDRWETYFESELFELEEDDIVIDVGAHIGVTSLLASKRASKVFAVEPSPRSLPYLRKNTENQNNIEIIERAAWNEEGTMTLQFGNATDDDSLIKPDDGGDGTVEEVRTDTLENIIKETGMDEIDLVKIEAEGVEPEIAEGIRDANVQKVVSTGNDERHGEEVHREVEKILNDLGYNTIIDYDHRWNMVYGKKKTEY